LVVQLANKPAVVAREVADSLGPQGLFNSGIGQVESVLDKVDSQQAFDPDGPAADTFRLEVERVDSFRELLARYGRRHFIQKLFLAKLSKTGIRKRVLAHNVSLVYWNWI
jgi:hypothetical protein